MLLVDRCVFNINPRFELVSMRDEENSLTVFIIFNDIYAYLSCDYPIAYWTTLIPVIKNGSLAYKGNT